MNLFCFTMKEYFILKLQWQDRDLSNSSPPPGIIYMGFWAPMHS